MSPVEVVSRRLSELMASEHSVNTADVRKVSAQVYKQCGLKDVDAVLCHGNALLKQRSRMLGLIAFDWAYRVRRDYRREHFEVFERWLHRYVVDWYDCDDICTHGIGAYLAKYPDAFAKVMAWCNSENWVVRRACAVSLIYPIRKQCIGKRQVFQIAEALLTDNHVLVQKGYGWLLKVLSQSDPAAVIEFLVLHHDNMPRTAFRYAVEKLSQNDRKRLMAL